MAEIEPAIRTRHARRVADLLPKAGQASFRRYGFMQAAIVGRWVEIVGEDYARHSTPERIVFPVGKRVDGTLRVAVTGAFAPLLSAVGPQIVERVNRFFGYGAVARLALRHRDPPAPKASAAVPVETPLGAETRASLREVADPELRGLLESLARSIGGTSGPPKIG